MGTIKDIFEFILIMTIGIGIYWAAIQLAIAFWLFGMGFASIIIMVAITSLYGYILSDQLGGL